MRILALVLMLIISVQLKAEPPAGKVLSPHPPGLDTPEPGNELRLWDIGIEGFTAKLRFARSNDKTRLVTFMDANFRLLIVPLSQLPLNERKAMWEIEAKREELRRKDIEAHEKKVLAEHPDNPFK